MSLKLKYYFAKCAYEMLENFIKEEEWDCQDCSRLLEVKSFPFTAVQYDWRVKVPKSCTLRLYCRDCNSFFKIPTWARKEIKIELEDRDIKGTLWPKPKTIDEVRDILQQVSDFRFKARNHIGSIGLYYNHTPLFNSHKESISRNLDKKKNMEDVIGYLQHDTKNIIVYDDGEYTEFWRT